MKRLIKILVPILLVMLLTSLVHAYVPEKTHVFQSGGVIRASELNQNDDDFFNAITDGQADLTFGSVSANSITCPVLTGTTVVATNVSASAFYYATAVTVTKSISFASFGACKVDGTNNYYGVQDNYRGTLGTNGQNILTAPVILPDGATVTQMIVSADATVTITLNSCVTTTTAATAMATAVGGATDSTITGATVDTDTTYYYLMGGTTGATDYLYYVQIVYTCPSFSGAN